MCVTGFMQYHTRRLCENVLGLHCLVKQTKAPLIKRCEVNKLWDWDTIRVQPAQAPADGSVHRIHEYMHTLKQFCPMKKANLVTSQSSCIIFTQCIKLRKGLKITKKQKIMSSWLQKAKWSITKENEVGVWWNGSTQGHPRGKGE